MKRAPCPVCGADMRALDAWRIYCSDACARARNTAPRPTGAPASPAVAHRDVKPANPRRNPLPTSTRRGGDSLMGGFAEPTQDPCPAPGCGAPVPASNGPRPRKYCTPACARRVHNTRRDTPGEKARERARKRADRAGRSVGGRGDPPPPTTWGPLSNAGETA